MTVDAASSVVTERRLRIASAILAAAGAALATAQLLRFDAVEAIALGLAILAGALTYVLGLRLTERVGPRHALDVAFPFAVLVLVVFALRSPLALPPDLVLVTDPVAGAVAGLLARGVHELQTPRAGRFALVGTAVGAGAWQALWWTSSFRHEPLGYLSLAALVAGAWWTLRAVEDPVHPGQSPLSPYVSWGQVGGRTWPAWYRIPLRAPATLTYLAAAWVLFSRLRPRGIEPLDTERYEAFLFEIPELSQAPIEAAGSLLTAPFLNHAPLQLGYVTVLLVLFGIAFEVHEGSLRASLVFMGSGLAGALVAGVLLHGLIAVFPGSEFLTFAWERTWSGGSAGAFGIMGGLAARARRPWPLFAFFVFWELNVGAWYLRSFTPAFHLTALATGFALKRWRLPPRSAA